jgi:glc operon protein GlcG
MSLTGAVARRMIDASQEKARELGVAVSTAIVDAEGRLFAFERMEGSRWISVEVSQSKAYTGALLGRDGPDLAEMAPTSLAAIAAMHHRALMPSGSVTTLREGNQLVAGIGCSGATDDQDGECAHAARDAYFA